MNKYLFIIVFLFPLSLMAENLDNLEKERLDLISKIENIANELKKEGSTENSILAYILDRKTNGISKEEGVSFYKNIDDVETEVDKDSLKEILKILIDIGTNRSSIDRLKAEEFFITLYEEIGITEELKDYLITKNYLSDKVVNRLYLKYLESSGEPDSILAAKYLSYLGLSPFELLNNRENDTDLKDYLWDLAILNIKPDSELTKIFDDMVDPETVFDNPFEVEKLMDLVLTYNYWDIVPAMLRNSSIKEDIILWGRFFSRKTDREIVEITIETNISTSKLIKFRDLVRLLNSRLESSEFKLLKGII